MVLMLEIVKLHVANATFNSFMTEAVIIWKPVHWTGFYMITTSVMKELTNALLSNNIHTTFVD